jgi:hypothetical protein
MSFMLGNMKVNEIQERLGIKFPDELIEFMESTHQPLAGEVKDGQWHCFDVPFKIVCGGMPIAEKIYNAIKDKSNDCKCSLEFLLKE